MLKSGEYSYPVKLTDGVYVSSDTSGLLFDKKTVAFTPEKTHSIQASMKDLLERVGDKKFVGEQRNIGRKHYTFHTQRRWLIRKTQVDDSHAYYQDDAKFYRGMVLGDLVVAALVTDGEIISGTLPAPYMLGTRVAENALEALRYPDFWTGTLQPDGSYTSEQIPTYLLQTLGISAEQLKDSIFMVPVVARFKGKNLSPHTFRMVVAEGYWLAQPPFTIDELTDACVADIQRWSGINLHQLQEEAARRKKEFHVSEKATFRERN